MRTRQRIREGFTAGLAAAAFFTSACSADTAESQPTSPPPPPTTSQEAGLQQAEKQQFIQTVHRAAGSLACMLAAKNSGAEAYGSDRFGNRSYILGNDATPNTPDDGAQTVEMLAGREPNAENLLRATSQDPNNPGQSVHIAVRGRVLPESAFWNGTEMTLQAISAGAKDMQPLELSIEDGDYERVITYSHKEGLAYSTDAYPAHDMLPVTPQLMEEFNDRTHHALEELHSLAKTDGCEL